MPKFYEHNTSESRQLRNSLMEQAVKLFPNDRSMQLAEHNRLQLLHVTEHGLPNCYSSFTDFLWDFYPDFSWDSKMVNEILYIMDHESFNTIVNGIERDWNFNMRDEFNKAVAEG